MADLIRSKPGDPVAFEGAALMGLGLLGKSARFARTQPMGTVALMVVFLLMLIAAIGPMLAPYDAVHVVASDRLLPPSLDHWMGTDEFGRDTFSRLLVATRLSIFVGFVSVLVGGSIGFVLGMMSAYYGGVLDLIVQRIVDAMIVFPNLILLIAVAAALGASLGNIAIAIGILQVPMVIRVIRSHTLSTREMLFVEAAKASGATDRRILLRHIGPNGIPLVMVLTSASIAAAIISESALSFLGAGVPPPEPTWGNMLNDSRRFMTSAPWMLAAPASAIVLTVMAFNIFGDVVRDLMDPRLRGGK